MKRNFWIMASLATLLNISAGCHRASKKQEPQQTNPVPNKEEGTSLGGGETSAGVSTENPDQTTPLRPDPEVDKKPDPAPMSKASLEDSTIFSKPIVVELVAESGLKVFYSLDGQDPHVSSREYVEPIIISQNTTLKFFARNGFGLEQPVQTKNYKFDFVRHLLLLSL